MKIGFLGLLTIVFITLKLTNIITWSWWLVLLPSIIGVSLVFLVIALFAFLDAKDPLWRLRK
jgi:hypothetical protein